jgi:hypothetical protein
VPLASKKSDRIHFPGLNTVRFFAAMAVVVHRRNRLFDVLEHVKEDEEASRESFRYRRRCFQSAII